MSESEDIDDLPQLSAETFKALQEFYKEQEEKERLNETSNSEETEIFNEDWQLSQFWYDEVTIENYIKIIKNAIDSTGKVALISCPTLYKKLKFSLSLESEVHLYEFDQRFAKFGNDFYFFDYKSPLNIPKDKKCYYDLVVADPPFLSEECLTKTAVTIKFMAKSKIILSTGAVMEDLSKRLLGLSKTKFEPKHKNNLANEFCCFSNFELDFS